MAKKEKPTGKEQVDEWMKALDHPLCSVIEALRKVMADTSAEIEEQVKWNAPAFYYNGEIKPFDPKEYKRDILVLNVRIKDYILLIFPTGNRVADGQGIWDGEYPDGRRMVKLYSLEDLQEKKKKIQAIVRQWLDTVEK